MPKRSRLIKRNIYREEKEEKEILVHGSKPLWIIDKNRREIKMTVKEAFKAIGGMVISKEAAEFLDLHDKLESCIFDICQNNSSEKIQEAIILKEKLSLFEVKKGAK